MGKAPGPEVDQRAGAEILHNRDASLATERGQLARRHGGREPDHAVVRGVNLEEQRDVGSDRLGVIAEVGPIGRAHLAQARTAPQHDVGNPELSADLDQLTA